MENTAREVSRRRRGAGAGSIARTRTTVRGGCCRKLACQATALRHPPAEVRDLRRGALGVDRLRRVADADRDLARLALLGLRDLDLEHAAVEARGHGLGVDALGQREGARERAERAL